ncbi:MAG: hypothetical protein KC589_00890 [Nanoarchaeota archaeon]|nr:hypothetical protein [Nanoarchaeota archaeon]
MDKNKKEKVHWWNTWWGIIIVILIIVVLYLSFIGSNDGTNYSSEKSYSLTETISNAKTIPYDDLFRYNEKYIETPVVYEGEILQIGGSSGNYYYRIDVTKQVNSWGISYDNTVYVTYEGNERFLDKDIIRFYGVVKGIKSYESAMGVQIEIPAIHALSVELVKKSGDKD